MANPAIGQGCCCCCCCKVFSVVSDSVQPHRRQPTRLHHPWDSPGKNTGVGRHFLLQCMKVKRESEIAQSCPTLHDPMDCSLPDSSIHGISQARVLEWVAIVFTGANGWVKIISTLILPATILDHLLYGLLGSVIQRGEVLGKYLKYVL